MKNLNNKKFKLTMVIIILIASATSIFYFINLPAENTPIIHDADLIIYTPLSSNLYLPIIKEFQERNHVSIEIRQEDENSIIHKLKDSALFDGHIILGIHNDTTKEHKDLFADYRTINSIPFVITFNNFLLTYREQIESYNSLIEPDLKGKIGFVDPNSSAVYHNILNIIANKSDDPELFKKLFDQNTKHYYLESPEDINSALSNGVISVGITSVQSAILLSKESANINYLDQDQYDCIINFDIALPKNSSETEIALSFFEFVQSNDVKQFISSYLNMDIGGQAYELD